MRCPPHWWLVAPGTASGSFLMVWPLQSCFLMVSANPTSWYLGALNDWSFPPSQGPIARGKMKTHVTSVPEAAAERDLGSQLLQQNEDVTQEGRGCHWLA